MKGTEIQRELMSKVDQRVFQWFRHMERIGEYHMARITLMIEASGRHARCKLRFS